MAATAEVTDNGRGTELGDSSWYDGGPFAVPTARRAASGPLRGVLMIAAVVGVVVAAAVAAALVDGATRGTTASRVALAPASAPPTIGLGVPVEALQTVPALDGVVITIDGHRYVSGADGRIAVDPADRHGEVQVVGRTATSPLVTATFTGWADGSTVAVRTLDGLTGPVVEIGFSVAYQVRIAGDDGVVTLDSAAGSVDVTPGQSVMLVAARAQRVGSGFDVQLLSYTVRAIRLDGAGPSGTPAPATFTPTPGAVWQVLP